MSAKTVKSRKRRAATKGEQVELPCRLWRAVLTKRDTLADASAAGMDAHALAARAQLSRLDAALAEYVGAQRGQLRLKGIVDRGCGD